MGDAIFEHPRLAAIYDALEPDRRDLEPYLARTERLGARQVLDVGCGTGTFALLLAASGIEVTGVDPAESSLAVARAKPGAAQVRWCPGDASTLPVMQVDLVTMTANVAQAIVEPDRWAATFRGAGQALRPGGHLVFETRDPDARAWERWNRADTYRVTDLGHDGTVASWVDVTAINEDLVTFRWTFEFGADATVLTSDSTLRFRTRHQVEADLAGHGYVIDEVTGAPDRPGAELVFSAHTRPGSARSGPAI